MITRLDGRRPLRHRDPLSVTYADPSVVEEFLKFARDHGRKLNIATGGADRPRPEWMPSEEAMDDRFRVEVRQLLAPFVWEGDYS